MSETTLAFLFTDVEGSTARWETNVAEARAAKDYLGPALNRVARVLGAAHGGQVLLSGAAAAHVRGHLPSGSALLDLGEYVVLPGTERLRRTERRVREELGEETFRKELERGGSLTLAEVLDSGS